MESVGDFEQYVLRDAKRRKVNHAVYKPGNIIKVEVVNFTTYSYGIFHLSPTLNMIIGPNGTGKSTLVAAICLGLAGRIDLIKRKNMKTMIKSGASTATIEITLQDVDGRTPVVIWRQFTAGESKWKLNGVTCKENAIKNKVKQLNIQLDNLCHFLPQERVAEFASLSPEKLLLETERTLGDGKLANMHEDLVNLDLENVQITAQIETLETRLADLMEQKRQLEQEAEKYEEYQKKSLELRNHKMLIPYAQLSDLKQQQAHIKQQRNEAKQKLEQFKNSLTPLQQEVEKCTLEVTEAKEKYESLDSEFKSKLVHYNELENDASQILPKIQELMATIDVLKEKSNQKKEELRRILKERDLVLESKNKIIVPDDEEINNLTRMRDSKQNENANLKQQLNEIQDKMNSKNMLLRGTVQKIKELEQRLNSNDKLALLEPNPRYVNKSRTSSHQAHVLLRKLPEFKSRYFECPIVSCNVTDRRYAPFLEKVIDNNTLFALTVTNQRDFEELNEKLRSNNLNIPIRLAQTKNVPHQPVSREKLRSMGFDGYLSDFIDGPKEMLSMLFDISVIHLIPVSLKRFGEDQVKKLTSLNDKGELTFRKFFAGDTYFKVQQSAYGNRRVFYETEKIGISHYFSSNGITAQARAEIEEKISSLKVNGNKEKGLLQHLQDEYSNVKEGLVKGQEEMNEYGQQRDEMNHRKRKAAKIDSALLVLGQRIKKLEKDSKKDYTDRIGSILKKITEKYNERADRMGKVAESSSEIIELTADLKLAELLTLQAKNREVQAQELLNELKTKGIELEKEYLELKNKYEEVRKGDAAQKIKEQSKSYTPEEREVLSALAKSYIDNGNFTEATILEKISLLDDERRMMSTADQSSIDNLKRKLDEIKFSEREFPRLKTEKERLDKRIEDIRSKWEPELTELVRKISIAFNKRFTKVASDGHVELAKNEHFKDWRLQILVKFRQESELRVLDHQSQSGGERAVSTIFFVMSLQGLTDAPFRVVDEINQGMDPKNEKMAHRYLVQSASQANSSQYFLVTPKLLTDLYYSPQMKVHCIFMGPLLSANEKVSEESNFLDFTNRFV
jgi:chromosome segregation ATPase